MKAFALTLLAFGLISSSVFAADSDAAFDALISSAKTVQISGDVMEGETFNDIVKEIFNPRVTTTNSCETTGQLSKCTLFLTYSPIGETAVVYYTSASGDRLLSNTVEIVRGD